MNFYITKDNLEPCKKRIQKMFAKFTHKPVVTYSDVQKVTQRTTTIYDMGEDGWDKSCDKRVLEAVMVSIEEIQMNEWRLVASVFYREGIVTICDGSLFKLMPKKYGLDYYRCDHCGGERERIESHVLYNTITDKWMQVGSSCVDKMIDGGKYLSNIMVELNKTIIVKFGGCTEEDWEGGGWRVPNHYWSQAFSFKKAVTICKMFYDADEKNKTWKKVVWLDSHTKLGGTNDDIQHFLSEQKSPITINEAYYQKVCEFISTLEGGKNYDGEPDLNQKMISAVQNEFITMSEMFVAYFAVKGYENSIIDFQSVCEMHNIVVGQKYDFVGKVIRIFKDYSMYDGIITKAELTDATGLHFYKQLSHKDVLEPYKQEDGTYKFRCDIRFISTKQNFIKFGGRLSKIK